MPAITPDELKALDFGYLTGADLTDYVAMELLISRYQIDSSKFVRGVNTAYSELGNKLATRYNTAPEFLKRGDDREFTFVKIVALHALMNILANMQNFSILTQKEMAWAQQSVLDIRNEQMSLNLDISTALMISPAYIVSQSFGTLG